jgi:hypothetical protein
VPRKIERWRDGAQKLHKETARLRRRAHPAALLPGPTPPQLCRDGADGDYRAGLGRACEDLVLRVLRAVDLSWLTRARRARRREDMDGVDVVVYTRDVGRLYLQVKRSERNAEEWRRRYAGDPRPVALVVAREDEDPAVVLGRVLGALILLRERARPPRVKELG